MIELSRPQPEDSAPTRIGAHTTRDHWRELATRAGDGLEISLHWSKSADRVRITVFDQRLDESFDIEVEGADALSAFEHPFAYAADRGPCSALRCASPSTCSRRTERSP